MQKQFKSLLAQAGSKLFSIKTNNWIVAHGLIVVGVLLPFLFLLPQLFESSNISQVSADLLTHQISEYTITTGLLILFIMGLTSFFGALFSWWITRYDFPGRSLFSSLLILPLAIPPYLAAYTYSDLLSSTSWLQIYLTKLLPFSLDPQWFSISSIRGAIGIFTLTLFPYVYLTCRSFLTNQSHSLIENGLVLGSSEVRIFLRLVLPLMKPAIWSGSLLVAFEVLSDFGVVSYFGLHTFTVGIFTTWFGMNDLTSAVKMAFLLLLGVWLLINTKRLWFHERRYQILSSQEKPLARKKLTGSTRYLIPSFLFLFLFISFFLPIGQMIYWASQTYNLVWSREFFQLIFNTLLVTLLASTLIIITALISANVSRLYPQKSIQWLTQTSTIGYSVPSAILAIGTISLFHYLDFSISSAFELLNLPLASPLSLTLVMLIFAYWIRFFAVSFQSIQSGFSKIGPIYTQAARTLGCNITQSFWRVDLPMIKPALKGAFILAFIDMMKELPLALTLRPFNFNTLGTKVYEYAGNEQIQEAALPSLMIVALSLIALYFILAQKKGAHS